MEDFFRTTAKIYTQHRIQTYWKIIFTPVHVTSDFSLGLNVSLAMERYFSVCHPLSMIRHPYLKKLSFYIRLTTVFVVLKDSCWYVTTVSHVLVITNWDSEVLVTSLLTLFSSAMAFAAVIAITLLNVLTVFKLRRKDPAIEASRVTFPNTKLEHKLIVIGIVTSFFCHRK